MAAHVFAIVLVAALFHASWNAFIKVDRDRVLFMTVMMGSGGLVALAIALWLPRPAAASWPYIAGSILLHQGYMAFLLLAYRVGDLSHVYPLARGSAPLIVGLVAYALVGETLSRQGTLALLLLGLGVMSLSLTRGKQGLRDPRAAFFALGTGLFIAAYTLTDGVGARLAGNAHSYAAWMLGLQWLPFAVVVVAGRRRQAVAQVRRIWRAACAMGALSVAAYWAVIWAMTQAPIALVAALRETSILFAVLFGVLVLKERLSLVRLAATLSALAGATLLRLGRP